MMSDTGLPILAVTAADSVQGAAVVAAAQGLGLPIRALTRRPDASRWRGAPGVIAVEADLDHPASLVAAFRGVHSAVVQVPTGRQDEMVRHARHLFGALRATGVDTVVLKLASAARAAPCPEPGLRANHAVEHIAHGAGLALSTLWPTLYLDNLLKPAVLDGLWRTGLFEPPLPPGQHVAWTSAMDCANAALTLIRQGARGCRVQIAGPESLTGDALMARLSAALGRPLAYRAQPVAAFEAELDDAVGHQRAHAIAGKFRYFAAAPDAANAILAHPFEPVGALAGFTPMRVEDWASRHRAILTSAPPHTA